jgi:uncharacterized protein
MKILVTGATGLIGKALVELLLSNNHSIHYLTTSKSKLGDIPHCKGFYWNLLTNEIDQEAFNEIDVLVHLAGASISKRWTSSYKKELLESRILSSNLLYATLKKIQTKPIHVISASGTAIYPDSYDDTYDENSTQKDNSFLGNVVVEWEKSIDQFRALGCKVTKVRTGIVFSNKGGALPEMVFPIKMYVGSAFGTGKQMQSWIHLDDLAQLYYFIIQNSVEGIVNAVAPENISNQVLTKIIAKTINRPLFLPNIPKIIMQILLGEMHILLFGNKRIIPKKALELGFKFEFDNAEKAVDNLYKKKS